VVQIITSLFGTDNPDWRSLGIAIRAVEIRPLA
jgi:hypothetical protein